MNTLTKIVEILNSSSIPAALWVDGDLLTEAENPLSFNIALVLTGEIYNNLSKTQNETFHWFRTTSLYENYRCHNYGLVIDASRVDGETLYRYWLRQYGFDRETGGRGVIEIVVPSLTP